MKNLIIYCRKTLLIQIGVFVFLNQSSYSQIESKKMNYQLSWDGQSTNLRVDMSYDNSGKDSSVFIYGNPDWGGQLTIFDVISQVTSDQDDSVTITPKDRKITIFHARPGNKSLHYEIDGRLIIDAKRARPNELFRPVIAPNSFYILGANLFLMPEDSTYQQMTVVWHQWPKDMPYLLSINPAAQPGDQQTLSIKNSRLLMMVMNSDLIKKEYKIMGSTYYMITSKKDTVNNMQEEIGPFYEKYFPSTRNFWEDYLPNYYFISTLPLLNKLPSAVTGINLGNGFSMKYSGKFDDKKKEALAHEISHTWIGKALKIKAKGFETAWFSEGFNDYICVYNLVRTGMFDKNAYLYYLNEQNLKNHYTNPANTAPADSIEKYFWTNHNYELLSYQRGFIYAFYLDNQMRLASGGRKNIRHFLLVFFKNTRKQTTDITLDDFVDAVDGFLPKERISGEIKKYMTDGQLIDFHKIRLAKDFRVHFDKNVPVVSLADGADIQKFYTW